MQRRRDELAARVAELHRDLGGLTYEMAIRDRFRLDVLRARAAALQECDAELAEIERQLDEQGGAAGGGPAGPGRSLRSPGLAALLVLVLLTLGFGVLTGTTALSSDGAQSHGRHLTLMLPAVQADAAVATAPLATTPPPLTPEATPLAAEVPETSGGAGSASASSSGSSGASAGGTGDPGGSDAPGGSATDEGESASTPKSSTKPKPAAASEPKPALPPIKHVFMIVLADQAYASAFGPGSAAPYLSGALERRGELLVRYYAVAHDELANEIALVSGLGPTADTAVNCPTFQDVTPAVAGKDGQYSGNGCVYPSSVQSVADQLRAKGLSSRVYAEDMENAPAGEAKTCRHPTFGAIDQTAAPRPGDDFATYRDPFSYFDSTIDAPSCAKLDTDLGGLGGDLKQAKLTPALSYIVPNLCHDGRETPCAPGAPTGLGAADAFLRHVVPEIMASPAYKQGGLLVITSDQAPTSGPSADSSSCCGQPVFPGIPGNQPQGQGPAVANLPPPGGGQVGALLLSPYVKAHTVDQEPFNHFSLLRTIEDLFGVTHLGYAGLNGVNSFPASVFARYSSG